MNTKRFIILFLIYIGISTISTAQTDSIVKPTTIVKIKDTIKTTTQPIVVKKRDTVKKESYNFIIGKSIINKSLWLQPYRFEDKSLKTLTVKIIIKRISDKKETLDFNLFSLVDESKKLRIKSSGVYYLKKDKKKYLKSKPVNKNYNSFKEITIEEFKNFEAETYKINFLGIKKKKIKPSVKALKKLVIKAKNNSYFLDFPVQGGFTYGKIYYNNIPIGFAAVR